jgi:hypothetical protein
MTNREQLYLLPDYPPTLDPPQFPATPPTMKYDQYTHHAVLPTLRTPHDSRVPGMEQQLSRRSCLLHIPLFKQRHKNPLNSKLLTKVTITQVFAFTFLSFLSYSHRLLTPSIISQILLFCASALFHLSR